MLEQQFGKRILRFIAKENRICQRQLLKQKRSNP